MERDFYLINILNLYVYLHVVVISKKIIQTQNKVFYTCQAC